MLDLKDVELQFWRVYSRQILWYHAPPLSTTTYMHMAVRWLLLSLVESVRGGTCELLSCGTDCLLRSNPEIATPLFRLEICSLIGNDMALGARVMCYLRSQTDWPQTRSSKFWSWARTTLVMIRGWFSAELIVASLKTNTNLVVGLRLRGNKFTETGLKILYASIFYDTSLIATTVVLSNCFMMEKSFRTGVGGVGYECNSS